MSNEATTRARFIRDYQLKGGAYAEAVEIWNAADEIADIFAHNGIRTEGYLPQGEIEDTIADWKTLRRLGL